MGSPSTIDPTSADVDGCGALASCFSLEEGTGVWKDPPAPKQGVEGRSRMPTAMVGSPSANEPCCEVSYFRDTFT